MWNGNYILILYLRLFFFRVDLQQRKVNIMNKEKFFCNLIYYASLIIALFLLIIGKYYLGSLWVVITILISIEIAVLNILQTMRQNKTDKKPKKKTKAKRDENGRFVKDEADLETPSL